jgi:hypothetical protein
MWAAQSRSEKPALLCNFMLANWNQKAHNNSMKIEQEYKDKAKKDGLALFSIMIDRRKIPSENGGGFRIESAGCMSLDKAKRIMEILREED